MHFIAEKYRGFPFFTLVVWNDLIETYEIGAIVYSIKT